MENYNMMLTKKQQKYQYYHLEKKITSYRGKILPSDQIRVIEQARFTYYLLRKALEKQTKSIEAQREKQIKTMEEHGK